MNEAEYHSIEQYLEGSLSGKDLEEFEHRMQSDSEFRNEVESVRLAIDAVRSEGLKTELNSIHEELFDGEKEVIKIGRSKWVYLSGIAASVLIFILIRFFAFNTRHTPEKLFEAYFEPFPDYVTKRNSSTGLNWEKGFQAYSEGKYQLATDYFRNTEKPEDLKEDIMFYLGMSYLAEKKNSEAIVTFSELLQQSTKYRQQLHWYLSLAYLEQGQINRAISVLKKIDREDYQYEYARELLELLGDQKTETDGGKNSESSSQ